MDDALTWIFFVVAALAIAFTLFGTLAAVSKVSNSRGYGHEEKPQPRVYPRWLRIGIAVAMMSFLGIAIFGPWEFLSNRVYLVFVIQLIGYLAYDAYLWLQRPTDEARARN